MTTGTVPPLSPEEDDPPIWPQYRVTDGTNLSGRIRVLWVRLDLGARQGPEWIVVGRINE